jgi:hypothetical protein
MNDLTMGPLPARFKTIKGKGNWVCGLNACFGRLAYVIIFFEDNYEPGEPEYDGPFLILQTRIDERPDGTFAKTARAVTHSRAGKQRRKDAKAWRAGIFENKVVTVLVAATRSDPTPPQVIKEDKREMLRQIKEQAYDTDGVRVFAWNPKDLQEHGPLLIRCPGCGRMNIISSVIGASLEGAQ